MINNHLIIIEQMIPIPSVGETEINSAKFESFKTKTFAVNEKVFRI